MKAQVTLDAICTPSEDVVAREIEGDIVIVPLVALDQFSYLRPLRATHPDSLRRCTVCFLKGLCEQCPAKSWTEHGTLDTPVEYPCDGGHGQARYLGWLGENEQGREVMNGRERVK